MYDYDLSGPTNVSSQIADTADFNNLLPGIYTVTVTDDNGCVITSNDIFGMNQIMFWMLQLMDGTKHVIM